MFGSDIPLISNQLPISLDFPQEEIQWHETVQLYLKRIANIINTKEGALYTLTEIANFQQYFTLTNTQKFRNVYRKTFDMVFLNGGNIGAGTTASFPHNIVGITAATRIFGTATTTDVPVKFIPLPYVSQVEAEEIQIYLTPTNVVLVNGTLTLTQAYITSEYVKN